MISIIYSTHKDPQYNDKFKEHLKKTIGINDYEILEYINHNQYSLSEIYNKGISLSKHNIVVCCHNDIKLENGWGKKLIRDFENNPDYGIIGKAGSCYFPESGVYWERMNLTMVGQVYHHPIGHNKWINKYSAKLPYLIPVVTIDGLFISFDKTKITNTFDESIGRFHFYDHLFCASNYLNGIKIGVTTSFDITHESIGKPNQEFWDSREKFIKKWGDKLPIDLKPSNPYTPEIKEKQIKNVKKVAVIIPTKNKVEMLLNCINSFYEQCNKEFFEIFIADTGSTESEKNWIKENILPIGNIKLIEYDYYNFAKINNDVVTNYVDDKFEFLLFCNNDIKILNNVIYEMIKTFKTYPKAGTVGARLHYEDNTVQHDGIFIYLNQLNKNITTDHKNKYAYFNYSIDTHEVIGNTAALMMIRKDVFNKIGKFNELYRHCFEDVELNIKLKLKNYINYINGNCVAYHYESKTRDLVDTEYEMLEDYNNILLPLIEQNFEKLKTQIYIKQ